MDLILRNAQIFQKGGLLKGDLAILAKEIAEVGDLRGKGARVEIDVEDRLILPGLIDSHTHFGLEMMGAKSPDDFFQGTRGAIFGGVTTVIDFTYQLKGESLRSSLERRIEEARGRIWTDLSLHVSLTDLSVHWKSDMRSLISQGFKSFKFFTSYKKRGLMASDSELFEAFSLISELGGLAMVHAENGVIVDFLIDEYRGKGRIEPIYHARSRPNFVEAEAISRVIYIAEATGCPLYIVHLSTKEGLDEVRRGKKRRVNIIAETCPQYLLLTEEKLGGPEGHLYIATPPLRKDEDRQALWDGLFDGTIDVVATDHAAYSKDQKQKGAREFHRTPSGLPGVETLFPLLYTEGALRRGLPLKRLVELTSQNPADIFGLSQKGKIEEGTDADLIVLDDRREILLEDSSLHGAVDYCPYKGYRLKGFPEMVVRGGEILLSGGEFVGRSPEGIVIPKEK